MSNPICSRPNCTRIANRQRLCHSHYERAPIRGYIDSGPTKQRIQLLLSRGVGWAGIEEDTGLTPSWWSQVGDRVQALTAQRVFSVPVPGRVVAGGDVCAVGTVRRIQALSAIGWPSTQLGAQIGHNPRYLSQLLRRTRIQSRTAEKVDALYRKLNMTVGPSPSTKAYAKAKGWAPPLAWNNIDDPTEKPNTGVHVPITAAERIAELHDLGITDVRQIAAMLRIKPESVERTLYPSRSAA